MNDDAAAVKQVQTVDKVVGFCLALIALGLYIFTLAPTVLEADPGEFQFVAWLPGIAHPTGYPLYILLGWVWTHLFSFGEVAWRMNLLSAIFGAAAVGVVYAVARLTLGMTLPHTSSWARIIAAVAAAALFAVTPAFWSQTIIAEVYALHALIVAIILWLALRQGELAHARWPRQLLALTFGLGLAHHVTIILLLPAVLLYIWRTRSNDRQNERFSSRFRQWLICALLFFLPMLLYLYLPLIAPRTPYTTLALTDTQLLVLYENTLTGFLKHITATVFTGELQPSAVGVDRLRLVWQLLLQQVSWVGVALALIGALVLWRRQVNLLILTGVAWLTIVLFNLIYFIGDVFVLFIPAWLLVCLWTGVGILGIVDWLARRFVQRKTGISAETFPFEPLREQLGREMYRLVSVIFVLVFLFFPIILMTIRISAVDQSHNTSAETQWQDIFSGDIPATAILLSNDRNEIMPMWYFQYVLGRRPDLLGLFPLIVPHPDFSNIGHILDQALASERPVYLLKPMSGLELKARIIPEGTLFRAEKRDDPPSYPNLVSLANMVTLLGYDLSSTRITPGDRFTLTLHWEVDREMNRNYTSFVHITGPDGSKIAQSDHLPGGIYYPTATWQPDEILYDQHQLSIPDGAGVGVYRIEGGMYHQPEPGVIEPVGGGLEVGFLAVKADEDGVTTSPIDIEYLTNLNFGDNIILIGYDLIPTEDQQLLVNLIWQAKRSPQVNWTVFAHLIDTNGNIIAQKDSQPRGGLYPTTVWATDEIVNDAHALAFPDALQGEYQVALGLYNPDTGERLMITDSNGVSVGDSLKLKISL